MKTRNVHAKTTQRFDGRLTDIKTAAVDGILSGSPTRDVAELREVASVSVRTKEGYVAGSTEVVRCGTGLS